MLHPMTLCEKIIARVAQRPFVTPGETLWVEPDLVLMYDYPSLTDEFERILKEELHTCIRKPEQCKLFIDHFVPAASVAESDFHHHTRRWAKEQGVELLENMGIGHQVSAEMGMARPGMFIAHSDMHVHPLGAFGAMTFSLLSDIITPYALGKIWLEVPKTIRVHLEGRFAQGVSGRDLINRLLGDLGPDGGLGAVLEFVGEGAETMSIDDRMTVLSEIMLLGAYSGIFPANRLVDEYLQGRTDKPWEAVQSDPDAHFDSMVSYDLSQLTPCLIAPSGLSAAVNLADVEGLALNQGYIGSCASGRVEDIETAARILSGKKIKPGFRLFVVPTSREIMKKTADSGALSALIEAGAFISSPSCDYCYGKVQAISAGERAVSTGTLNVPGRMGSTEAEIYLCSAAVVAASAITGTIQDPRNYL